MESAVDRAARRMAELAGTGQTVTPAEIEKRCGMPVASIQELMRAFGVSVPQADEPAFTPVEGDALVALWREELWPFELAVQFGRLYGRLLARIAHATMRSWATVVEPHLIATLGEDQARLQAVDAFERLLPVSDALLAGVHRRWLAREAVQLAFSDTPGEGGAGVQPGAASSSGAVASTSGAVIPPAPGAVEVSFLFCDLKDFTSFTDRLGDDAAIRIIDRFAEVVSREQGADARLTKLLGDGFMCVYSAPRLAVDAGARVIEAMRAPGQPGVHASVHHGLAIPREGDYFGTAVNLTARLLGEAGRDELVATSVVMERCPEREWRQAGSLRVRGVSRDVEVFKLVR
jgi:class 3 adenylate cyclase